ncbi:hypothetical protein BDN70DRAFT_937148 [Pholiota conissans]|uniref:Arrestin-like N-terminal domain-containing protein n=1 Tax=Pholiota conissans TaxID=109636 RepID=A0A9P6CPC8_9AGAR|nr:hypothetical protein BDN70DRAFT_937148 [Pholiota conissans]
MEDLLDVDSPPPYVRQDGYSKQREMKEFSISFKPGERVEGSLNLFFDSALSKNMPTLIEGSPLKGNVTLKLDRPDSITSVSFGVDGEFLLGGTTGTEENYFFLKEERSIWSSTDGEPRPSFDDSTPVEKLTFKGTLHGGYTWPISFDLPKEVEIKKKQTSRTFPLPQSFSEKFIRATIRYTVWVKVARRGFLATDKTLSMPFTYVRVTSPPALPPLREVVYQEGTPLLSPSVYPDGWHTEGPLQIKGILSKTVPFTFQCTLYLAKPLAYTTGNFVPLFLKFESDNVNVLELLSNPKAIHARIRRYTVDHIHASNALDNNSFRDYLDYSQRAVWWPSDENTGSGGVRLMNGEVHLKPAMYPNTELGNFRLRYSVMLYDFEATALEFRETKFLQEVPIEICTLYGPGPRPKSVTPHNTEPDVGYGKLIVPYMNQYSKGFY